MKEINKGHTEDLFEHNRLFYSRYDTLTSFKVKVKSSPCFFFLN